MYGWLFGRFGSGLRKGRFLEFGPLGWRTCLFSEREANSEGLGVRELLFNTLIPRYMFYNTYIDLGPYSFMSY